MECKSLPRYAIHGMLLVTQGSSESFDDLRFQRGGIGSQIGGERESRCRSLGFKGRLAGGEGMLNGHEINFCR